MYIRHSQKVVVIIGMVWDVHIIYICKHRKIHSAYDVTSGLKSFATIQFIIYSLLEFYLLGELYHGNFCHNQNFLIARRTKFSYPPLCAFHVQKSSTKNIPIVINFQGTLPSSGQNIPGNRRHICKVSWFPPWKLSLHVLN